MELAKVKNVANRWLYLEDDAYLEVNPEAGGGARIFQDVGQASYGAVEVPKVTIYGQAVVAITNQGLAFGPAFWSSIDAEVLCRTQHGAELFDQTSDHVPGYPSSGGVDHHCHLYDIQIRATGFSY